MRTSGGIEAMSLSADGQRLMVFLEKPLLDETGFIRGFEFDLASRRFLPITHRYPMSPGSTSVGELATLSERAFLFIERDDSEGVSTRPSTSIWARWVPGQPLSKRLVVDLLQLADPAAGRERVSRATSGWARALPSPTSRSSRCCRAGRVTCSWPTTTTCRLASDVTAAPGPLTTASSF